LGKFDGPLDEEQIVNPIDTEASDDEKVRQLQRLTRENEPQVKAFLDVIDTKYGTESKTSQKENHKIIEKAHRPRIKDRKRWFKVEHIRDSFRFKTVLNDVQDLPKIAKDLKDSGLFEVVKTDTGKVLEPDFWGWRIAVFDLKMPNGQLVEYYLPVKELEEAKKNGNHQTFEKWRNVDLRTMTKEQALEYTNATRQSFNKYDKAFDSYLDRTKQNKEQVVKALDETHKVLPKQLEKKREIAKGRAEEIKASKPSKLIQKLKEQKAKNKEDDLTR